MKTTPAQRQQWQIAADAATPGPWECIEYIEDQDYGKHLHWYVNMPGDNDSSLLEEMDAHFIAATRTAVPALLADVAALEAEVATLRTALRSSAGHTHNEEPTT